MESSHFASHLCVQTLIGDSSVVALSITNTVLEMVWFIPIYLYEAAGTSTATSATCSLSTMGGTAVKQRRANAQAAQAAKLAKKNASPAVDSSTLDSSSLAELAASSNPPAIDSHATTSKRPLRSATQLNPETSHSPSTDFTQRSLPRACSTSATIASASKASVKVPVAPKAARNKESTSGAQSSRKTADASRALLQKVINDMELSGDSDTNLHGKLDDLQEYEEDKNSLEIESIHGSSDDGIDELVITPNGQLSVMKPSKKAAKPKKVAAPAASCSKAKQAAGVLNKGSDSDSADHGEILCHRCLTLLLTLQDNSSF